MLDDRARSGNIRWGGGLSPSVLHISAARQGQWVIPGAPFRATPASTGGPAGAAASGNDGKGVAGQPGAAASALTAVPALHPEAFALRTGRPAPQLSPPIANSPFRYFLMKSRP